MILGNAWLINTKTEHSYQLLEGENYIGRSPDNDVVIEDPTVSRNHALIRYQNGEYILSIQAAQTDIRVNNYPIERPIQLSSEDEILFGSTIFHFVKASI